MVSQLISRSLRVEKKNFEKLSSESTTIILQFISLGLPSQWVVLLRDITKRDTKRKKNTVRKRKERKRKCIKEWITLTKMQSDNKI